MGNKIAFHEVMDNRKNLIESRKEYNKENRTNMNMVNYLHNVLNYPMDEAEKIRNKIYKKKLHPSGITTER